MPANKHGNCWRQRARPPTVGRRYPPSQLGAVSLQGGDAPNALVLLEAALHLVRQLGDGAGEADVLYNLGKAARAARQPGRALQCLDQALASARATGDRFAEKLTLDHLGSLHAAQHAPLRAIATYQQALALAHAVGHRAHEADLLWTLAIQHAEQDCPDQAVPLAQAALALFTQVGHPNVALLADHLQKYQCEATRSARCATRAAVLASPAVAALTEAGARSDAASTVSGPSLLRMAFAAAKSMARFVGSGMP